MGGPVGLGAACFLRPRATLGALGLPKGFMSTSKGGGGLNFDIFSRVTHTGFPKAPRKGHTGPLVPPIAGIRGPKI